MCKKELRRVLVKEGAAAVKEKAGELSEEAKKQYQIFELKKKVSSWMADLGGLVYQLATKGKNPMNDVTVKLIITRINKLETRIAKLEGRFQPAKSPAKKPVRKAGKIE